MTFEVLSLKILVPVVSLQGNIVKQQWTIQKVVGDVEEFSFTLYFYRVKNMGKIPLLVP